MRRWTPSLRINWLCPGAHVEVDQRLLSLLGGIAANGTLGAASRDAGMSYRSAWALLQPWVAPSPHALAKLQRGEGATLTPAGETLLQRHRALCERLKAVALDWQGEANADVGSEAEVKAPLARYACAASHDFLLGRLAELARAEGLDLDITFRGSGEAIAALVEGRVALAGFHVPVAGSSALRRQMLAPLAALHDVRTVRLFVRNQGLIVGAAGKRRVTGIADLARRDVRFVNRQRGSGTRQLFDAMLAAAHIDTGHIDGYAREEFTHAAVAATVAAGSADAGFGIAAAAAQFDLAFVPLTRESYVLALRRDLFDAHAEHALLEALRAPAWRELVAASAGYTLPSRTSSSPLHAA